MMDYEELAKRLMSESRRTWQDPEKILRSVGIREGMVVADLGCGPGFFAIPMANMVGNGGMVYAVDSSHEMLVHLNNNIGDEEGSKRIIKIIHSDAVNTGIPTSSVDVVFFANVLHDITDRKAFFEEIKRICKHGALVVDIDWKKARVDNGPPLELLLSQGEEEAILSENGLEVFRRVEAGPNHYGLVCRIS